jgi:hypothetical protein
MMATIPNAVGCAGRYEGPGLYETIHGDLVYLDPLPQPQSDYLPDWLIWSETIEDRNRPGRNRGAYWGLRDMIEPIIVCKVQEGGTKGAACCA